MEKRRKHRRKPNSALWHAKVAKARAEQVLNRYERRSNRREVCAPTVAPRIRG